IDLSKIESRPSKTSLGEYFFVIDLVMDKPWQLIVNAFEEIQLLGGHVHLLGVYSVNVVEEVTKYDSSQNKN
ncbi:MAG: prephenate dehydratase, partial [Enterococcus casseliflavus]